MGCPSGGGSSCAGWIDPLANFSVPNRPVRPALGTAGLTQAFSETAGPDYGKPAFQKKKPGPAWVTCRPRFLTLTLICRKPFLQIKVRVDTRDFSVSTFEICDHSARNFTSRGKTFRRAIVGYLNKCATVKDANTGTRYWIYG